MLTICPEGLRVRIPCLPLEARIAVGLLSGPENRPPETLGLGFDSLPSRLWQRSELESESVGSRLPGNSGCRFESCLCRSDFM